MKHKNSVKQSMECLEIWLNARKVNNGFHPKIKVYGKQNKI